MSSPCFRLKSYEQNPPGGFPFEHYKPVYKSFPSVPMIEHQAQIVSAWRKNNGLERASVKECLVDVDHYTCRRLGAMSQFCIPCNATAPETVALNNSNPIIAPPCRGCGAPVQS